MAQNRRERGDGTVFHLPKRDRWAVEFTLVSGKKTRKTFVEERDARKFAKATSAKKHLGIQPVPSSPRLNVYMDDWLETVIKRNRSDSTYQLYKMIAKNHIYPSIGKMCLNEIQRNHVQKLLNDVASKNKQYPVRGKAPRDSNILVSRNTVRNVRAVISSCLSMARKDQHVYLNVAQSTELPADRSKSASALNHDQAQKLLNGLGSSSVDSLIAFLLLTGCRIGEGQGVRWIDLSDDFDSVWIRGQLKREAGGLKYSPTTKTHRDRLIHVAPFVSSRLRALRATQANDGIADPDGIAFLSSTGNRFDPKTVNVRLDKLCADLELPRIKIHELRHTAATLMAQITGDIHAVQKALGHSQVSLTANLYAHATQDMASSALHKLGASLSQSEPIK